MRKPTTIQGFVVGKDYQLEAKRMAKALRTGTLKDLLRKERERVQRKAEAEIEAILRGSE